MHLLALPPPPNSPPAFLPFYLSIAIALPSLEILSLIPSPHFSLLAFVHSLVQFHQMACEHCTRRSESIRHSSFLPPLLSMSLSAHSASATSKLTGPKLIWTTVIVSEQLLIPAKAPLM